MGNGGTDNSGMLRVSVIALGIVWTILQGLAAYELVQLDSLRVLRSAP
jgi:hypothetical protein